MIKFRGHLYRQAERDRDAVPVPEHYQERVFYHGTASDEGHQYQVAASDPFRDLFEKYAQEQQWGNAGKLWVNEILYDERTGESGEEIWDEFAGMVPKPVKQINPFDYLKANMWIFDNMPTSVQWVADTIIKNANSQGLKLAPVQTGKHGVEKDPSRYERYMKMPSGAPPSFVEVPSGSFIFGVGRFIAAMLRNDDQMNVIPITHSEAERAKALTWVKEQVA